MRIDVEAFRERVSQRKVNVFGKTYRSLTAACFELGISQPAVAYRMKLHGETLEQAIDSIRASRIRRGIK